MRKDLWKYSLMLAAGALLGYVFNHTLLFCLIAALGIIAWQLYQLNRFYRWVIVPKSSTIPETSGLFYLLHREVNRRNLKNRKRKRQLSNYLNQFRKAASALPDAIVMIDDLAKIEWANRNAENLLGIDWPSDKGVRFTDLIRDPKVEKLISHNQHNDATSDDIEIRAKHNAEQTINIKLVRYTKKLRMVIARDVSRLVKVNKIQSDFVANVSHELKTPLTVLKGYLEIFQQHQDLPQAMQKPIEQMALQTDRMQFIVDDLLYLAKLEDNLNRSEHIQIDVTRIVNTIMDTIQEKIQQKQQKIQLHIDYTLPILGNEAELHAAFSNLIFNAVHYTPTQGVIQVSWQASENGGAKFIVKDNGEGIPAAHLSRLTQRFYRVDNDRSRQSGGTGLGLAIVKHALERHNAVLHINSKIGVGSEFICLFPLSQIEPNPQAQLFS